MLIFYEDLFVDFLFYKKNIYFLYLNFVLQLVLSVEILNLNKQDYNVNAENINYTQKQY